MISQIPVVMLLHGNQCIIKLLGICILFQGCQLMYKIGSLENNLLLETQLWFWISPKGSSCSNKSLFCLKTVT